MRKNGDRIYIGDIIITNKNFKPVNKINNPVDLEGKQYKGMVVSRIGSNYGVRFGPGLEFTHYLDGLLGKPVGYLCEKDDFDVEKSY